MAELIVAFEIVAIVSMLVVLAMQRPGVTTERFAARHGQTAVRRRRAEVAKQTEAAFGARHPAAKFILFRAGGFMLFVGGLALLLVSTPMSLSPRWINTVLISIALVIQLVAVVLFDYWGILLSRRISIEVHRIHTS